ncbi:GNAT family N-acetyltransferase [Bacillus cereus]|uniref:GNAT family N-acetyltransferase n=1 Tax=Bacillus cereus TaxID=1396 RepID=UPI000BEC1DF4|nr:GNAT family N-acetyltransferase [Bacillus cereus]PEE33540.1 spermidine acetyltransferase [Bacillus cereus]PET46511.1 spermidine acetyltransferase [Bacillus cereus]PEV74024.1 spermidine acetyltransferase [Bacillus cereus]PFA52451.1 spermidine acetyltransferase [Bacillus cereus]PFD78075.1 spermidine acetyltransferase [Bacillus cereus]
MKKFYLKPIDKNNWEEAIRLSVKKEQQTFIASNLYSIAEVQFLDNFYVRGIYLDNEMIGFTMFGIDPDDNNYWIYRLMIDEKFQGKGIGKQAIYLVIEEIRRNNSANISLIMIGYDPENLTAKFVYQKAGFIETELSSWGEQLAKYSL